MSSKKTVLLVEDEPLIADIVAACLGDCDFQVVVAGTGDEALDVLRSGAALDALVTDIRMPGELSGWDLARMARTLLPWLPVVYITGHAAHDWHSEGVPRSLIIPKPFSPEYVAQQVRTLAVSPSS